MRNLPSTLLSFVLFLSVVYAAGIGVARNIPQYPKTDYLDDYLAWHDFAHSPLEVRTINGFGRKTDVSRIDQPIFPERKLPEPNVISRSTDRYDDKSDSDDIITYDKLFANAKASPSVDLEDTKETDELPVPLDKFFKTKVVMKVLMPKVYEKLVDQDTISPEEKSKGRGIVSRVRRETETPMEKISGTKNVREARLNSPDSWSKQPISVEFRHRTTLDEAIQGNRDQEDPSYIDAQNSRGHQAPHTDFVTSQHRRYYPEVRESRDMPMTSRNYDDYDGPWYRNSIRERDYYEPANIRRGYRYPDRYRTERDYYTRPYETSYYYDRYRDDDMDVYGRARPTVKPKRIIYYATLPEVVRKPVDLRSYPRPYETSSRPSTTRETAYKRIPGNVDPNRYRYRQPPYDTYESYSKRSSYYENPHSSYPEDDGQRKNPFNKDSSRVEDVYALGHDRKLANQVSAREDGNLPWPVQIGTEVTIKDDERIPGRKIFGDSNGFERIQTAQLRETKDVINSAESRVEN